mgnify:FL=1
MCERKYRHELKHYINHADYLAIRRRLREIAPLDRFSGPDGSYTVHSLYFDNLDNKALREKLDGVNNREKFRLRYYNGDLSFLRLEKKSKRNGLGCKAQAAVTREECERLLAGDAAWMENDGRELVMELSIKMRCQLLRPLTPVVYTREAYVYPAGNVRVTVDSGIRTGFSAAGFLDPGAVTVRTGSPILLEVKFDEVLPDLIGDLVQERDRQSTAFSKYAACRTFCGQL